MRPFNEEKATQACAYLLAKAPGGCVPYIKALKLLYFFERECLKQTGYSSTGDTFFIMKHGPVLSNTMDLMREEEQPDDRSVWHQHIQTGNFDLKLKGEPKFDLLSLGEKEILESLWAQYGSWDKWAVVRVADELPENIRIESGRVDLGVTEILEHQGTPRDAAMAQENEIGALSW